MRSLFHKFLLFSSLIILLPMALAILWSSKTLSTILERRFAEKSNAQAQQVRLLLNERQETATGLVHWIAEMPGVSDSLARRDRASLFQYLLPLVGSVQLDFIEILDRDGRIFLRVHDPTRYGDAPALAKDLRDLLQGRGDLSNYGVEERDGWAFLRAAETIQENDVVGVVSAGYALNRDLVKKLEQIAGGKVVIAIGDRLYAADGARRVANDTPQGILPKSPGTQDFQWHRDGAAPTLEVRLLLETDRGTEGLISIFFPSQEMTAAIGILQKTLLLVALLGSVLALSISCILGRRLVRPLKELVRGTEQVGVGNYSVAVRTESKDEIGALAESFNRMLEELRRSRAEVESYRDELERKFAARGRELAETEKKRAAMAHMIAHDLKNPLLGIKKTLERLEQTPPETNGEHRKKILHDLLSASDLITGMVNEMLDLYRSDFGEIPLSLAPLSIEELIQTSLRILGPEMEEKSLQVLKQSDPPHISVVADKRRLTRLLINLLSNAIKFSPDHGHIYVSARILDDNKDPGGRYLLLRVEDEGMGILKEDLPMIFDRFYSRDQGKVETGTGLGLPYCKLVAEAHGGKIWAESRDSGGLAVSVVLTSDLEAESRVYAP
ncbi:MAG: HAMP domain-containing protein [Deltaproteobacteria bacterium]|nr:HAMP domain-containing protein [Deltaproteobacteria bacterium]